MALVLLISDTHNKHAQIPDKWLPEADIIIHAGDMTGLGKIQEVDNFMYWYSKLPYKHKICIPGNHDFLFEDHPGTAKSLIPENVIYLENSGIEIEGIKIWGTPHQPEFHSWAFNVERGKMHKYWNMVDENTELLISHGPPHGILDMCMDGSVVGCEEMLTRMSELKKLKLCVFGHVHEARGTYRFVDGQLCINASLLNARYDLVNTPYLIDTKDWRIL